MIKVLNIISDKNIGGAGRCVLNFLEHYDRKEFAVKVVVPQGSLLVPEIKKRHTQVIEVDGIADTSFDRQAIGKLCQIIKKENPHIVHTHGAFSGRVAGKLCRKKVVYTRHSVFPVSPKIKYGAGRFCNKVLNEFFSDDIIAVAEAAKENLTDGGISPSKVRVILNGVEQVHAISQEEILEKKHAYGIGDEDFVLGILARLDAVKGHTYLIEAAELLKKQGKQIKVLIAGAGGEEEHLKELVLEKGLSDVVVFTGFIQNVQEFLSLLDIQINASYGTEATSLALLEGMSMGIPAVVSKYGGNPGVIQHGENGYLFESRNTQDLVFYIKKIMEDKKAYEELSKNAVDMFQKQFTAEIYAKNIEGVYRGLAAKKGAMPK